MQKSAKKPAHTSHRNAGEDKPATSFRVRHPLPVRMTEARRAALAGELATLNGEHRELQVEKARAAKEYARRLAENEARRIPLEEALKKADDAAKRREVPVLPVQVECEARPVPGKDHTFDVFRMDTVPPTKVAQVFLPASKAEQAGLPGIAPDGAAATATDPTKEVEAALRKHLASLDLFANSDPDEEHPLG